jgi:hypothetical protein
MQAKNEVQELFEDLHLSPSNQDESDSSISADCIVQHRPEAQDMSRCNACCKPFDADEQLAKLISYFVNRGPQQAAKISVTRVLTTDTPATALPPPVRYARASRKAVAKPTDIQHREPSK